MWPMNNERRSEQDVEAELHRDTIVVRRQLQCLIRGLHEPSATKARARLGKEQLDLIFSALEALDRLKETTDGPVCPGFSEEWRKEWEKDWELHCTTKSLGDELHRLLGNLLKPDAAPCRVRCGAESLLALMQGLAALASLWELTRDWAGPDELTKERVGEWN